MKVTYEAMAPAWGQKARYAVLVDGEKIGVVAHERVEVRRRHTRFLRDWTSVDYSRRSRPLAWVARGTSGRKQAREVRTSRKAAVAALLESLGLNLNPG